MSDKSKGRPAAFPGVETVPMILHVPAETRAQARKLAAYTDRTLAVTIDAMVREAFAALEQQIANKVNG